MAECRLTYSMAPLPLHSFFWGRDTHSHGAQEATQSTGEKEHSLKAKQWIWRKTVWPAFDRRGEGKRSNKQRTHTDTNRHVDLEPHHPTLFQFPVNGHNSICLQAVQPNTILSTAGSDTATILCSVWASVCGRERERERERESVCVCE